ncbi:hypothetical protein CANTEDRAFT_121521 [Yamadazyma tenuis ATCC 10573]|uniref:Urea carboxylase n=1 Tax=Candida tenuis (strain ATCC 10573 / BCRC 21748 / CBS 615 / JCM 9827 / NBRC 10315 / NRRL Y-1498 / VKM Y-70) TaxID=590646 RepID=G3B4F9_CANTC|nr:uncharacterized protein CANTEDRAFT_121521 [Yamadazyma tenuis ATCC 10573]EGV63815.1 hypothetical protein CANTEDRAFT_121521 [Yamadazyma tenuis ATCC 10573]
MSQFTKIKKVLVANRGEIACRIIRSCKENGLYTIGIYSTEDCDAMHVVQSDESHLLPGVGANAYINIEEIVKIAIDCKADVVVPGYGFLSENSAFADALENAGIIFAGPSVESVETFGLKHSARVLAEKNHVPVVPGSNLIESDEEAVSRAREIGYPIMIKSTAGGGGMGLKVAYNENELIDSFNEVVSRGQTLFKNSGAFLEKYVEAGRHIEVQIFGNGKGGVVAFGERECSIQRRHQKVIEEAPSPFVVMPTYNHKDLRTKLSRCAIQLASSINYKSAGTVEFLVDDETGEFYFLEMNTRLQVEHGITELIYNVDLMKLMLLQAEYEAKGSYEVDNDNIAIPSGHAIEVRVYAENPIKNFQPSPGILHLVEYPETALIPGCKLRIDHWVSTGSKISPYFDPLIAKIMVWGPDRQKATKGMIEVLENTKIYGPTNNIDYLTEILKSEAYQSGNTLTSFLNTTFKFEPSLIEFVKSGAYTTIQDLPGREACSAGVPLSGPADPLSFQIANLLVGNKMEEAGLEISSKGPYIKFHAPAVIALAGSHFKFKVNGKAAPMFAAIEVPANSIVKIGDAIGNGQRSYLAIQGGLPDVAEYLGSKSCTPTLNYGGHQGRVIMAGDCIGVVKRSPIKELKFGPQIPTSSLPDVESYDEDSIWTIRCVGGPHDTPGICDRQKLDKFYNTIYSVNLNSNRGCTRLDGQADVFSRPDGRDGGTHPSNILEYPYPTCGISVVGSMMALFGVDGGTLSGFVCISVPIKSEWWKSGQAKVSSKIQFKLISYSDAIKLNNKREAYLEELSSAIRRGSNYPSFDDDLEEYETDDSKLHNTILYHREKTSKLPELSIRQAGEKLVVVDFGIEEFTLVNNGRYKQLETNIHAYDKSSDFSKALIRTEITTGAIGVLFETNKISRKELLEIIIKLEAAIPPTSELKLKSTLYKLPICFDHSALKHCIDRYIHSQRPYAPYLPNNTEYIMRANNLATMQDFKNSVIGQTQVVTAVSFLCANTLSVNLDPRTRIKTGKYNPARTFTPKGAIGSGSVATSIYSIDSPGGYMIWGMVLPDLCWNTFSRLSVLKGKPYFYENFDQISYYEVSEEKLAELNTQLLAGRLEIETEEVEIDFNEYINFLKDIEDEVKEIDAKKQVSMDALIAEEEVSRAKWLKEMESAKTTTSTDQSILNDPSTIKVMANMAANIFKINVKKGDIITGEDVLIILEAMKMEIPMRAINEEESDDEDDGPKKEAAHPSTLKYEVLDVIVNEGDVMNSGDVLMLIKAI